jgi:DNA-binding beta-propeller fold protein YncE
VVNNSGVIFAIDINTFRLAGSITGFTSPRYIHFVDDDKAYVTQLWDERICVVDPRRFRITGYINTGMEPGRQSTEQMVAWGKYLFVSCWSYNSSVLVVDTETDTIVERIDVGAQPNSMALDAHGKLWVRCEGIVGGAGVASLWRVDARTRQVESVLNFAPGDTPRGLIADGAGETLYFINRDVWKMPVASERLPETPFIRERRTKYYSLTVNPINSEVYVADAIDYVQPGIVFRYSPDGEPMDEFRGGITPGGFCWR